jgi:hypothetical protein
MRVPLQARRRVFKLFGNLTIFVGQHILRSLNRIADRTYYPLFTGVL